MKSGIYQAFVLGAAQRALARIDEAGNNLQRAVIDTETFVDNVHTSITMYNAECDKVLEKILKEAN